MTNNSDVNLTDNKVAEYLERAYAIHCNRYSTGQISDNYQIIEIAKMIQREEHKDSSLRKLGD